MFFFLEQPKVEGRETEIYHYLSLASQNHHLPTSRNTHQLFKKQHDTTHPCSNQIHCKHLTNHVS